jgi:hypothetical protein
MRRPIMFKTPLVQALLRKADPKTETLRERGLKEVNRYFEDMRCVCTEEQSDRVVAIFEYKGNGRLVEYPCFWGKPGDELYIQETYALDGDNPVYKADNPAWAGSNWKSSMMMPEKLSRITRTITSITITTLHAMDDDHARAEGVVLPSRTTTMYEGIYRDAFFQLWDSIYGVGDHLRDRFLWRIAFTEKSV